MNTTNIALAAIMSAFAVIFINRIYPSKNKFLSIRNVLFFLTFGILFLVMTNKSFISKDSFHVLTLRQSKTSHFAITPEVFNQIIKKDVNYISGAFYQYEFKRIEFIDADGINFEYKYTLLHLPEYNQFLSTEADWENMERKDEIREYALLKTKIPHTIFYILKRSEDYEEFCRYIVESNPEKNIPDSISIHFKTEDRSSLYAFKDCLFNLKGFQVDDNGYRIEVYDRSALIVENK